MKVQPQWVFACCGFFVILHGLMLRTFSILFAILLLAGCGGGQFVPSTAPFSGQFTAAAQSAGDFSFTASATGIGGTGTIRSASLEMRVAISANVSGQTINGSVS